MELDDGHGDGDGQKMDQVLHIWKRRKGKTKERSRQRYNLIRFSLLALKTP
jgi:hypothetical protein